MWAVDGYGFWSTGLPMDLTLARGCTVLEGEQRLWVRPRGLDAAPPYPHPSGALCLGRYVSFSAPQFPLLWKWGRDRDPCLVHLQLQGLRR